MIVATWNVNSLTARWARVAGWLEQRHPDVVLLQETKQDDSKFPFGGFAELGYEAVHHGQGRWNGVAILSRVGLEDVARGFGDEGEEARLISATCAGTRVHSCYVPNGRALDDPHYAYKLEWLGRLASLLDSRDRTQPVVVGGDFNVAPSDLDVWDPSALTGATHVSDPERQALAAIEGTGLVDAVRALHPEEVIYTWWDYRQGSFHRGWGMRIDLLLVDEQSAGRVTAAWVDREARKGEKPSDHAPVIVELA